jgi:hypothetical protein
MRDFPSAGLVDKDVHAGCPMSETRLANLWMPVGSGTHDLLTTRPRHKAQAIVGRLARHELVVSVIVRRLTV